MSAHGVKVGLAAALTAVAGWGLGQTVLVGHASHLEIDPGLAQTWVMPGPELEPGQPGEPAEPGQPAEPEEPEDPGQPGQPEVDLSVCGDPTQYDGVFYGTEGPEELDGGNGRQILVGLGGDDVLIGGNGDDCLIGGAGDDELLGGNGADILVGGEGVDVLDGGNGADVLHGDDTDTDCSSRGPDVVVSGCPPPEPATPQGTGPDPQGLTNKNLQQRSGPPEGQPAPEPEPEQQPTAEPEPEQQPTAEPEPEHEPEPGAEAQ